MPRLIIVGSKDFQKNSIDKIEKSISKFGFNVDFYETLEAGINSYSKDAVMFLFEKNPSVIKNREELKLSLDKIQQNLVVKNMSEKKLIDEISYASEYYEKFKSKNIKDSSLEESALTLMSIISPSSYVSLGTVMQDIRLSGRFKSYLEYKQFKNSLKNILLAEKIYDHNLEFMDKASSNNLKETTDIYSVILN